MPHSLLSPKADHEARILKHLLKFSTVVQDEAGYYVWWPRPESIGSYTSWDLKTIAKILDDANRLWDEQVRRDLS